jgi:hypothetical protein
MDGKPTFLSCECRFPHELLRVRPKCSNFLEDPPPGPYLQQFWGTRSSSATLDPLTLL